MRRRVGFARAIALNPEILLFDEPTTGLDPVMTDQIDDVINNLRKNLNATIVTITHDMTSALSISDRIAMLHEGNIVFVGDKEAFLKSDIDIINKFLHRSNDGISFVWVDKKKNKERSKIWIQKLK